MRAAAFPSGGALARHLAAQHPDGSWHQTRVSKLERGEQRPTETDIRQWADAIGASAEDLDVLMELLAAARIEYATHRDAYRLVGGAAANQASIATREAEASRIAEYQPAMVPGLVQTAPYARELLSLPCGPTASGAEEAEITAMVAERIRRQEVLYQPGKQVQVILGEAALRTRFGAIQTLAGQLDRLVAIAGLDGVELGVVPFASALPVFPIGSFVLNDDCVFVESLTGVQRLDEPEEVAAYLRAFELLREIALTGVDAVALIQRVAAELARELPA